MAPYTFTDGEGKAQTVDAYSAKAANDYATARGGSVKTPADEAYDKRLAAMTTPTVVTDANVREKVIPETLGKFNDLTKGSTGSTPTPNPQDKTGATGATTPTPGESSDYTDLYKGLAESLGLDGGQGGSDELAAIEKLRSSLDATTSAALGDVKGQYGELEHRLNNKQDSENNKLETALLNAGGSGTQGGLSRYAPGSAAGLVKMKAKADIEALGDLHAKEQRAVASATAAKASKDFQLMQSEVKVIEGIRKEKMDLAKKVSDSLIKENTKARAAKLKASRDAAIIGLVGQGITDPQELIGYLNYDESGDQVGDFTSDEIAKTLKNIAPGDDLKGLSGNVKNFMILKDRGELPGNISSLPEEQQLYGYLRGLKSASTISSGDPKKPSTKKIARTDIDYYRKQGIDIPYSVIGESEKSVIDSFKQDKPPAWFYDYLVEKQGNDNYADTKWGEMKKSFNTPTKPKKAASDLNATVDNIVGNN